MTGYTVHTGTNEKYAAGWDQIFSSGSQPKKKSKTSKSQTKAKAKSPKKKSGKAKRGK